jgi:hypothetical protein
LFCAFCTGLRDDYIHGADQVVDPIGRILEQDRAFDPRAAAGCESKLSAQAGCGTEAHAGAADTHRHRLRAAHRLSVEGAAARVRLGQRHSRAFSELAKGRILCEAMAGLVEYDEMEGIAWRWQSIDGAMGNAPLAKRCVGADPTDREEKRRKRSLLANARGVPLLIAVSGANTHDVKLLAKTLEAVVCERPKPRKWKPQHLCADAGYNGNAAKETVIAMNYRPHIEQRKEESSDKKRKPGCKARRWVVEQTHSWLNRFGKLPHE